MTREELKLVTPAEMLGKTIHLLFSMDGGSCIVIGATDGSVTILHSLNNTYIPANHPDAKDILDSLYLDWNMQMQVTE